MLINGWEILFFRLFYIKYRQLVKDVDNLRKIDPTGYKRNPRTKLLARVTNAITVDIPQNPLDAKFRLGKTLGKKFTSWRRAKSGVGPRYRLFFRFSTKQKNIIIAWMNDEFTYRKYGSKSDVYNIFKKMLSSGKIPTDYDELVCQSIDPSQKK